MNELYGGFGSTPIDDDILSMFGGTPSLSKPQAQAQALRTKPRRESTSITQNVVEQSPAVSSRRALSDQQAMGQINAAQQEIDKYTGPQDYTAMQDYAKQRAGGGQKSLLLALAAQTAGKEYAPVGAAYLKRAMESREPLKTATGFIDETGQHIEDPQAQAMQRLKVAEAKMARAQQILQSNASAEEKAAAQQETLALRREQMEATMEMRRLTIAAMQSGRDARAADRAAGNADKIGGRVYDDFMRNTKDQQTQVNAYRNLQATAKRADAASDLSFIFQYMKMLDPGSVVRESEYATAQNARGVPDTVRNLYNSVMEGRRLTPGQREQFLGTAGNLAAEAEQRMEQVRADLIRQLPPGTDPSIYLPGARAQAAPAAALPGVTVTRGGGAPAPQPSALPPGVTVTRGG